MKPNERAGSATTAAACLAFTVTFSLIKSAGHAPLLPWWAILTPGIFVATRAALFHIIANAVREGVLFGLIDRDEAVKKVNDIVIPPAAVQALATTVAEAVKADAA